MSFVSLRSSLETNTFSPTHIHQSDYAKIRHSTREYFNEKYVNKKLEFYKAVDIVFWRQWEILDQGYCYEYFLCYTKQIELVAVWEPTMPAPSCFQIDDKTEQTECSNEIFKIVRFVLTYFFELVLKGLFISLYSCVMFIFHFWRFDLVSVLWITVLKVAIFKILDLKYWQLNRKCLAGLDKFLDLLENNYHRVTAVKWYIYNFKMYKPSEANWREIYLSISDMYKLAFIQKLFFQSILLQSFCIPGSP